MLIPVTENLKKLSKIFPNDLYIVGGYVRNHYWGIDSGDVDLASDIDYDDLLALLKKNGYSFKVKNPKTFSVLIYSGNEEFEFTCFRKDTYGEDGSHMPASVERTHSIEEDAARRDFTVNAIYYSINKDEIVDLFHGIVDTKQRILRCITSPKDVLQNDGERILRLIRLAGELNCKIDKETFKYAIIMAKNIKDIPTNRRLAEIEKILYCDKKYPKLKSNFKCVLKMLNKLQIWQYLSLNTKYLRYNMVKKVEDRAMGLLIDIVDSVKPACIESFLENLLKGELGVGDKQAQKIIIPLCGYYNALYGMKNKEYFFKYFEHVSVIFPLLIKKSKRTASKYTFFYEYILRHGLAIRVSDLNITADDITANFPYIDQKGCDRILDYLLNVVFDGKVKNEKEALLKEIEKFFAL